MSRTVILRYADLQADALRLILGAEQLVSLRTPSCFCAQALEEPDVLLT